MPALQEAAQYWQEEQISDLTDDQWGDTGKGKLADEAGEHADAVVKTNGGANAGHTVNNLHGEFKFHLTPAAITNPDTLCIIGQGSVADPFQVVREYEDVHQRIPDHGELVVSDKTPLVLVWHKDQDNLREVARGGKSIGTTGRGIGPAYADHTNRVGLRMGDLLKPDFEELFRIEAAWQERQTHLMHGEALLSEEKWSWDPRKILKLRAQIQEAGKIEYYDQDALLVQLYSAREALAPMIKNTTPIFYDLKKQGKRILGEAGQGQLLDLDQGGYPFVTSSHPGIIGMMISTGFSQEDIGKVVGSTKAYMTRVGNGPMPTELTDEVGNELREKGREYGTTTKRPRRCGWFDVVATKHGAETAGVTEIALMKLDILDEMPFIEVCVAYDADGVRYDYLADTDPSFMEKAVPVYERLKGWNKSTTGIREFHNLPQEAQDYVLFLQEKLNRPIRIISVGPERGQTIYRAA